MTDIITLLKDPDDKKAYAFFKEIKKESEESNVHYPELESFAELIGDDSSYVRTRGFSLCCAQARWDEEGKLQKILPKLMDRLRDEKPTAVRQCIKALHEAVQYRSGLCRIIESGLKNIEPEKYSGSMRPLIEKDMESLRNRIKKSR